MKKFNKKHLLIAVSCLVVLAVMAAFTALIAVPSIKNAAIKSAKESLFENYYTYPESGMITAANGFKNNKKNSLLFVKSALEYDADCIEVDVCFDENGVAYIAENADEIDENTMPFEYRGQKRQHPEGSLCMRLQYSASSFYMEGRGSEGGEEMNSVYITAIICVTIVMVAWINRGRPRR